MPGELVPSDPVLQELQAKALRQHAKLQRMAEDTVSLAKASVRQAAVVGSTLLKIKRKIGHGNWEPWVRNELKVSPDTALRYMTAARKWPEIKPLLETDPMLSLSKVLGLVKEAESERKPAKPTKPAAKDPEDCTTKELVSCMRGDICHHLYEVLKPAKADVLTLLVMNDCDDVIGAVERLVKRLGPLPQMAWEAGSKAQCDPAHWRKSKTDKRYLDRYFKRFKRRFLEAAYQARRTLTPWQKQWVLDYVACIKDEPECAEQYARLEAQKDQPARRA